MSDKKLSESLNVVFGAPSFITHQNAEIRGAGIIDAVRELEAENERLKSELSTARDSGCKSCDLLHKAESQRDALRTELEETRLSLRTEKAVVVESENVRVALRAEVETLRRERNVAVNNAAHEKGWRQQVLAILDAVPVQEEKACGCGLIEACHDCVPPDNTERDYDVVTREIVLCGSLDDVMWVLPYEEPEHDHELARTTVTFKVPRKTEVKQSLAERLEKYMNSGFTEGSGASLIEEVRALENKKPDDPRSTKP